MSIDTDHTPANDTKRTKTPKAAAPPAKRAGRPAAPQTVDEMVDAYTKQIQAARKSLNGAAGLLSRIASSSSDPTIGGVGDSGLINWRHLDVVRSKLTGIDYNLHAAQLMIGRTGFSEPTDKL